jgi:hypothetical protein
MKKYMNNYEKNNLLLIQRVNLMTKVILIVLWLRNFSLVANKVTALMTKLM